MPSLNSAYIIFVYINSRYPTVDLQTDTVNNRYSFYAKKVFPAVFTFEILPEDLNVK